MGLIYCEDILNEKVIKEFTKNEDLIIYFEVCPTERGIVIGKDLSYIETFGRPSKRYKKYNEFNDFVLKITKLYYQIKEQK